MRLLQPNTATIAAKVIDGEAIIMNLGNGAYYSMSKVGATIWEMIERGSDLAGLEARVVARYVVDPAQAHEDLERLVAELLAEQLIVAGEEIAPAPANQEAAGPREAYEPPVLNKYTEMADLLALDPPMPVLPSQLDRAG